MAVKRTPSVEKKKVVHNDDDGCTKKCAKSGAGLVAKMWWATFFKKNLTRLASSASTGTGLCARQGEKLAAGK